MGGGVSSLPDEVSLAEAKELAGARWQPAWEEKFAEAKISRDEAVKCWKESEAKAAISEELYEKLHGTNRSGVAEALDFSAIIAEKRGQHLPGTREWVFEAVMRWRTDPEARRSCFWLVGGGGTGKSVAAAELLARLLDKQNAAAWHFCKHTEPGRSAPAVLLRSLAGMLCATVEGFEDALKESAGVETDKVDELFEALVAAAAAKRRGAAPRGRRPRINHRRARRAAARRAQARAGAARERTQDAAAVDQDRRHQPRRGANQGRSLKGYTPSELRVDEARNRQDVRAYLTELAKEHVELEVTMESLRHEVEVKFPELAGRLGRSPTSRIRCAGPRARTTRRSAASLGSTSSRGLQGATSLDLKQDEGDFETLYADRSGAEGFD